MDSVWTYPAAHERAWTEKREGNVAVCQTLNDEHAKKVGAAIANLVQEAGAGVIVLGRLDLRGKKRPGSKAQKLPQSRRNTIQEIASHRAHRLGRPISCSCPWNTSRLAYDGSGWLKRGRHNKALVTFSTGKQYNVELNAANDIGARYFLRELLKPLTATERSRLRQKFRMPGAEPALHRIRCWQLRMLWRMPQRSGSSTRRPV